MVESLFFLLSFIYVELFGPQTETRSCFALAKQKVGLKALTDHLGGGSRVDSFDPQW